MKLPKPENWTPRTTERVIERIWKLFNIYEKYAEFDDNNRQINQKANEAEIEGMRLQDIIGQKVAF
jgi:hypothetical protein